MARLLTRRTFLGGATATVGALLLGCAPTELITPRPSASTSATASPAPTVPPSPAPSSVPISLRGRIARMLMAGFPGAELAPDAAILRAIREGLGGVILFARNIESPAQLVELTSTLRDAAGARPLLIAIDQEGGAVARLNPGAGFPATPTAASIGRRNDREHAREVGAAIGGTLSTAGINLNLAPVVDLNVNPANPSIGALGRSFSADPDVVVAMAGEFTAGHREHGVLTTLKHFPGLGSATGDTDREFVDVSPTWSDHELEPFRRLISSDSADLVMVGNALNDQLDARHPASLSRATVSLLRDDLGWRGVVITDDLMAGAISQNYGTDDALRLAVNAGNDILLLANTSRRPDDVVGPALDSIAGLVAGGDIDEAAIDAAGARIGRLLARVSG